MIEYSLLATLAILIHPKPVSHSLKLEYDIHTFQTGQGMNASINDTYNLGRLWCYASWQTGICTEFAFFFCTAWKLVWVLRGWSNRTLLKTVSCNCVCQLCCNWSDCPTIVWVWKTPVRTRPNFLRQKTGQTHFGKDPQWVERRWCHAHCIHVVSLDFTQP